MESKARRRLWNPIARPFSLDNLRGTAAPELSRTHRQRRPESMDKTYNLFGGFKPTTKRRADLDGPDFYPTPQWATEALIDIEEFNGSIWEPACGDGAMSEVLKRTGNRVFSSDLYDRSFGEVGIDFLKTNRRFDNVVTNPPYNSAENFIHHAREVANKKFAFLLRLAFLEGINRQKTIFSHYPPTRIWVFSERITFYPKGADRKGSGTTAYAWFVWDNEQIGTTELKWIPVGYKKRG